MKERRKFPRLNVSEVMVTWKREESTDCVNRARDISSGGICILLDKGPLVKVGEVLNLEFRLPTGITICSKGRTAWVNKLQLIGREDETLHEAGLEFLEITSEDKQAIEQFVFSRAVEKK